ncbi:MAG: response regulator transcription factor [Caulobacter sp.]|nr:response regulator transcription factor [Caulobacter sp.]
MARDRPVAKPRGASRRPLRDERSAPVTSGDSDGTKAAERRATLICIGGAALFIITLNVINTLTTFQDAPDIERAPVILYEATSAVAGLALIWLPWMALRRLPLNRRPLWRTLGVHALVLCAFSLLHVSGFVLLRKIAFGLVGETYDFGSWVERFPYEFRKDAFYYVIVLLCFWLLRERIIAGASPPSARPSAPGEPTTFDIRDGARLVRTSVTDILAISSAGNYAEFHLADGRKPLMRVSLASLEDQLGDHGLVRTHRSWLVNAGRVTELTPEGSGDYAVTLGGVKAPLSRRFPEALARLRGG